jgi:hypothetical protein
MNKLIRGQESLPSTWRAWYYSVVVSFLMLGLSACELNPALETDINPQLQTQSTQGSTYSSDANSVRSATVLSYQLPNPYTVANMRQAYQNLYGGSGNHINASHLYVRFKPTSKEQLLTLIETLDLDLYEVPLDYKISHYGDFYQDPSVPMEEITWQYTVVPVGFSFPAGIHYQTLSEVYVPAENQEVLEAEAQHLVGLNPDGDDFAQPSYGVSNFCPDCDIPICAPGYTWDDDLQRCVPDFYCPPGFYESGGNCVAFAPARPVAGRIRVKDTQFTEEEGLANARVVAKRWFKIERMYTDVNGNFTSSKKFKNSVKVNIKFKNSDAVVRGMLGARYWQILFPVTKEFGPFKGNQINTFTHTFERHTDYNSKQTRLWVAATTHNAVQQFKVYSALQGTGQLPNKTLKILLTNWGLSGAGSAPLFSARFIDNLPEIFVTQFIASSTDPVVGSIAALILVLKSQIDITYSYNFAAGNLTSDRVVKTIYHELAHATLYRQAGPHWYDAAVEGTIQNMLTGPLPYGNSNTSNSPIIAMNEGWAYHYGNFLANARYGNKTSCVNIQKSQYFLAPTSSSCGGDYRSVANPYLEALERFNPNLPGDPFNWIPKGIFHDLMDDTATEFTDLFTVDDQVSDFTNSQLFNAIEQDVRSPQTYRIRLLQQNNNWQVMGVNVLFKQYNYE